VFKIFRSGAKDEGASPNGCLYAIDLNSMTIDETHKYSASARFPYFCFVKPWAYNIWSVLYRLCR